MQSYNRWVLRLQGNDAWGMKFLQTIGKRETRTVVSNVKFVCKLAAGNLDEENDVLFHC